MGECEGERESGRGKVGEGVLTYKHVFFFINIYKLFINT